MGQLQNSTATQQLDQISATLGGVSDLGQHTFAEHDESAMTSGLDPSAVDANTLAVSNAAAEAAQMNVMLRTRLEIVNKSLKEVQETYTTCEKLPEGTDKTRKMEHALKEIISLTEEKVRLMELIAATGSPAAGLAGIGYNLSLLDLAQLQQLLVQSIAHSGQTQQQKDDHALNSAIEQAVAASSAGLMDHSHMLNKASDSLADYVHEQPSDLQFPMMHEDSANDSDTV